MGVMTGPGVGVGVPVGVGVGVPVGVPVGVGVGVAPVQAAPHAVGVDGLVSAKSATLSPESVPAAVRAHERSAFVVPRLMPAPSLNPGAVVVDDPNASWTASEPSTSWIPPVSPMPVA